MSPKIVIHRQSERLALFLFVFTVFVATLQATLTVNSEVVSVSQVIPAAIVAVFTWVTIDFLLTKRQGVLVRSEYNPKGTTLRIALYQGVKTLTVLRIDIGDHKGTGCALNVQEVKSSIVEGLKPLKDTLLESEEIHFVGLLDDDVEILMRLVKSLP